MPALATPDTRAGAASSDELAELLHSIVSWPYLQVERRTDGVTFLVRHVVVGTANFRTRALSVNVPPDTGRVLLDGHPQLVRKRDSVTLRMIDSESCRAAEGLLQWRIELERFAHQRRTASP